MNFKEIDRSLKMGHLIGNLFLAFFEGVIPGSESFAADLVGQIKTVEFVHLAFDFLRFRLQGSKQFLLFLDGMVGLFKVSGDVRGRKEE